MQKQVFSSFLAASALLALAAAVPSAQASEWNKMTYVTINEKVIAGDKVLEPGTYVWRLLDSQSDRHIVQIFNKDQTQIEETILAIPNYRLQPTGDSRFAFWETPPGVPKAIRAWFYPGDNFGQEFQYPKKLVAQLASAVPVPVAASYNAPAPAAEPQPAATAPAAEPTPQPEPAPAQQASQDANAAPAPETPAPATLPHTAGNTPLIALFGVAFLSLAGLVSLKPNRR